MKKMHSKQFPDITKLSTHIAKLLRQYPSHIETWMKMTSCSPHISHINLIYFHPIYITTKVVSSNLVCGEVIRFVTDLPPGQWFSPGTHVSSANKIDRCDIPEILLYPPQRSCRGVYWFHHVRPSVDKSYVVR